MKWSIYNNVINLQGNVFVVYNSLTDCCVCYNGGEALQTFDSLSESNKLKLLKCGIMVDDDKDEASEAKELYKSLAFGDKSFMLIVNPTLNCNFRCWYCYEGHEGKMVMSKEIIERVKCSIKEILEEYEFFELSFFGGEPLLQYDNVVKPLMLYVKTCAESLNKRYVVSFTTNGYLISDEMIFDFKKFNIGSFQITLDGNKESHNKTRVAKNGDSYEKIVGNIKLLANAGFRVLLRINVTTENICKAKEIVDDISSLSCKAKQCIMVTIQQVWQDNNDLLEEISSLCNLFTENGFRISTRPYHRLRYICYGDRRNTAVVNYNGNIYKCTALDFDKYSPQAVIYDKDWLKSMDDSFQDAIRRNYDKTNCLECRIFPLCGKGCAKIKMFNASNEYCLHPKDTDKDKVVFNIIKEKIMSTKKFI